jgi:hypothetical protein
MTRLQVGVIVLETWAQIKVTLYIAPWAFESTAFVESKVPRQELNIAHNCIFELFHKKFHTVKKNRFQKHIFC